MNATQLPKSYEELVGNQNLESFYRDMGWLKKEQNLAIIPDENGRPVIYQPGQFPKTPEDWEKGTPVEHLLGNNARETNEILSNLSFRPYRL